MLLITISRQTGSLGDEIAANLAQKLNIPLITRDFALRKWFPEVASKHELHMLGESPNFYSNLSSEGTSFALYLENRLRDFTQNNSALINGMGAEIIFAKNINALHVKILSSLEVRIERIMKINNLLKKDAERIIEIADRKHTRYLRTIHHTNWSDPLNYHLIINTDFLTVEESASMIYHLINTKKTTYALSLEADLVKVEKPVIYKNPSEEEFAKILDMYELKWEYEPRTFPIKWDAEGNIIQAFSPDFYLPDFDQYIELTIMNQKYTSVKKKKVELLKKLYPGINISIVFKDDFHSLIKRFSMFGGADSE
ncbi:MAG: cytidylate kinase family protein [Clostridiaceae bacterium]